jgi:hypothetical protein
VYLRRYFTPEQAVEYGIIDKVMQPSDSVQASRTGHLAAAAVRCVGSWLADGQQLVAPAESHGVWLAVLPSGVSFWCTSAG